MDSSFQKWSNNDTDQTPKDVKLSDNGDNTFSIGTSLTNVGITKNSLDVNIQDVHTILVNQEFHQATEISTLFAGNVTAQDRTFAVVDATGFTVGDSVEVFNGIVETQFPRILEIDGNNITIDRPIDLSYTNTDGIRKVITNMAVNGSVTPQSFKVTGEQAFDLTHIARIIFEMTHTSAGDLSKFGNLNELPNGMIIRAYRGDIDVWKTFTNWRKNADIKRDMYDVDFDDRSGGQGLYGTTGRATFLAFGAVAELDPDEGDFIEILIQDDLTGLESFTMNAQGHIRLSNGNS